MGGRTIPSSVVTVIAQQDRNDQADPPGVLEMFIRGSILQRGETASGSPVRCTTSKRHLKFSEMNRIGEIPHLQSRALHACMAL